MRFGSGGIGAGDASVVCRSSVASVAIAWICRRTAGRDDCDRRARRE